MTGLCLEFEPPTARLALRRPERRNAMSDAMWRELPNVCTEIEARTDVRAVIVEGVGGHFCAGADIGEFDEVFADLDRARAYLRAIELGLGALCRLDRPTIAKLEGSTFGGGLALALACDLRFAAEGALFSVPPAKLGLLYGPVETRLLVDTVGPAAAKDLLFSGRVVDAQEAVRLGLINRSLPRAEIDEAVQGQVSNWASLSQISIRGAKKAVHAALASDLDMVRSLVEAAAMSGDFREGRSAFKEKRVPRFNS